MKAELFEDLVNAKFQGTDKHNLREFIIKNIFIYKFQNINKEAV